MSGRDNESGMALMLALLFVVLLTVIVVEFCYETQVEGSLALHYVNEQQAYVAAKSAVARGMSLLAMDIDQAAEGVTSDGYDTGGAMFDCLQDAWAEDVMPEPINEAIMQCMVDDEYGKINLNALVVSTNEMGSEEGGDEDIVAQQGLVNEPLAEALRALFAYRGTEEDPVDAIIDWVDSNDDAEYEGAEADYYEGLEPPFGCKNGPMDSVEELLMIPGITPDIFWGDPEEGQLPLSELLTVHGHPQGYVNVNTAEYETLLALGEMMQQPDLADSVWDYRGEGTGNVLGDSQGGNYFQDAEDVRGFLGIQEPEAAAATQQQQQQQNEAGAEEVVVGAEFFEALRQNPFIVESLVFRVRGHGLAGQSVVRVEAYVWRNNGMSGDVTEPFRIIDWRVTR